MTSARKILPYKPIRNVDTQDILNILNKHVKNGDESSLRHGVVAFLDLPGIRRFLSKLDRPQQTLFMHYCLLYLKIYLPECRFEIDVTDRYPLKGIADQNQTHLEGCVVARQLIPRGQPILFLHGWLADLKDDDCFPEETDFSIINTENGSNLLLGPARFVNHDCNPNCVFSRKGKQIALRAIKDIHVGQELTVTYAKNYFGFKNRECRCVTCEIGRVNGFGAPNESPSADESDTMTKLMRKNRKLHRLNGLVSAAELSDLSEVSSRSPSLAADADSPATSVESDAEMRNSLKSRLRQRGTIGVGGDNRLFKFTFEGDDARFTRTRQEWRDECRTLAREDRDVYTLRDFILAKLSRNHMYKELQRFYHASPLEADPDLTLDCVNCQTPFFAPDDSVAPRRLPTRLCPRCNRHAVLFNAYWPSVEPEKQPIELFRAWDFTSLKNIGVRGEFDPESIPTSDVKARSPEPELKRCSRRKQQTPLEQESDEESDEVMPLYPTHKRSKLRKKEVPKIRTHNIQALSKSATTRLRTTRSMSSCGMITRSSAKLDPRSQRLLKRTLASKVVAPKNPRRLSSRTSDIERSLSHDEEVVEVESFHEDVESHEGTSEEIEVIQKFSSPMTNTGGPASKTSDLSSSPSHFEQDFEHETFYEDLTSNQDTPERHVDIKHITETHDKNSSNLLNRFQPLVPIAERVPLVEGLAFTEAVPFIEVITSLPKRRKYKQKKAPFKGFDIQPAEMEEEPLPIITHAIPPLSHAPSKQAKRTKFRPIAPKPRTRYPLSPSFAYPPLYPPPLAYPAPYELIPHDAYWRSLHSHPPIIQPMGVFYPPLPLPLPPPPPPPPPPLLPLLPPPNMQDLRHAYQLNDPRSLNGYSYPLDP